ncbi:hypothetical protein [Blastococcus brunescens]|uniref:Thiamine pyrophosphate enzyme central domain-containing protein n=1 Tax=Blastococcus brunescens TaxID=1564165 RepID=A0ABZ1B1Z1_9ACTN|nr:hypothetical protein [Blastococcus sp. BMG 8361]WRL64176.1 hypothetical protein U6N30_32255 [Blastococcus sp. BMG 8361]
MWAGGGATAAGAGDLVARVAERLGAPVLTSYGGRGLLSPDSPWLVPLPRTPPRRGGCGTTPTWCSSSAATWMR